MSSILSDMIWCFVLGLDNAGKTTLISYLEKGTIEQTEKPTLGMVQKRLKIAGKLVNVLDFGGQAVFRKNWLNKETWGYVRKNAKRSNGITIFIVNLNDNRWEEAKIWYQEVARGFNIPELIIFTKTDLLEPEQILEAGKYLAKLEIDNELLQTAFTTIKDGPSITKAFENAINAKVTSLMKKE